MRRFFFNVDLSALTLLVATNSISIGVMFELASGLFNRQSFYVIAHIANRHVWATCFVTSGVFLLISLLLRSVPLRRFEYWGVYLLAPVMGFLVWTVSLLAMFLSIYPPPTATGLTTGSTLASIWILIRWERRNERG